MNGVLPDLESRSGSATSLLRTVVGLYLRDAGWVGSGDLVTLMGALGLTAPQTRTAVTRVKARGVLQAQVREGRAGYTTSPEAQAMLARGDRRIFTPRQMAEDDRWCVISTTLSEARRQERSQWRRRLEWIGCGSVAPGLWIAPVHLQDEVVEMARDLGIESAVTLFAADRPVVAGDIRDLAASWWDLARLADLHEQFIATTQALRAAAPGEQGSFHVYVRSIDAWRVLPYLDPGLPDSFLPGDWPGRRSVADFERVRAEHETTSATFVRRVLQP